jgi:hypothetical protein
MEDITDGGPAKHPIEHNPWETILDFALPAEPGCDVQAVEKILESLGEDIFRPDRLLKLKSTLEEAIQKTLAYACDARGNRSIHFRVLVSGVVPAMHFSVQEENAPTASSGCGFFLVQMMDDTTWAKQTTSYMDGANHSIFLYIYGEGSLPR